MDDFPQKLTVGELRKKAAKYRFANPVVVIAGAKIASSFWGKSWCRAIEAYQDMDYRLNRGRSYLRHGSVVDLAITPGRVEAKVVGTELYDVVVRFAPLEQKVWNSFVSEATGQVDSLLSLLSGKLPDPVLTLICDPKRGLFPNSRDIRFSCTCLDDADLCKHVAATLYGIAVCFDTDSSLFFRLREVDPNALISAGKSELLDLPVANSSENIASLFHIDLDS